MLEFTISLITFKVLACCQIETDLTSSQSNTTSEHILNLDVSSIFQVLQTTLDNMLDFYLQPLDDSHFELTTLEVFHLQLGSNPEDYYMKTSCLNILTNNATSCLVLPNKQVISMEQCEQLLPKAIPGLKFIQTPLTNSHHLLTRTNNTVSFQLPSKNATCVISPTPRLKLYHQSFAKTYTNILDVARVLVGLAAKLNLDITSYAQALECYQTPTFNKQCSFVTNRTKRSLLSWTNSLIFGSSQQEIKDELSHIEARVNNNFQNVIKSETSLLHGMQRIYKAVNNDEQALRDLQGHLTDLSLSMLADRIFLSRSLFFQSTSLMLYEIKTLLHSYQNIIFCSTPCYSTTLDSIIYETNILSLDETVQIQVFLKSNSLDRIHRFSCPLLTKDRISQFHLQTFTFNGSQICPDFLAKCFTPTELPAVQTNLTRKILPQELIYDFLHVYRKNNSFVVQCRVPQLLAVNTHHRSVPFHCNMESRRLDANITSITHSNLTLLGFDSVLQFDKSILINDKLDEVDNTGFFNDNLQHLFTGMNLTTSEINDHIIVGVLTTSSFVVLLTLCCCITCILLYKCTPAQLLLMKAFCCSCWPRLRSKYIGQRATLEAFRLHEQERLQDFHAQMENELATSRL